MHDRGCKRCVGHGIATFRGRDVRAGVVRFRFTVRKVQAVAGRRSDLRLDRGQIGYRVRSLDRRVGSAVEGVSLLVVDRIGAHRSGKEHNPSDSAE